MEPLLPSPVGASPPIRVPFVEGFEFCYGQGNFTQLETCVRRRSDGALFKPSDLSSLPPLDRAACIQAWLFFGLFSTFLQCEPFCGWAIRHDETQEFDAIIVADPVTMTSLVDSWASSLDHLSAMERSDAVADHLALLNFAADECDVFDDPRPVSDDVQKRSDLQALARVLFSVRLALAYLRSSTEAAAQKSRIGDTVAKALKLVDNTQTEREWGKVFEPIPAGGHVPLSALPLLDQFRRNRWCPIRAHHICESYDYTVVSYLSRVPRLDPEDVTHDRCQGGVRCRAYDFDEARQATYKPKHTQTGCLCSYLGSASDKLTSIIANGDIPLISMDPLAENLDLKVHKFNGSQPYTAISHVWSDGLGNPHENALPTCQLKRMATILTNLKERNWRYMYWEERLYSGGSYAWTRKMNRRVYFWMDTLCIPVQVPPDCGHTVKEIKRRAIRHITPIFEAADQILVLDAELEQLTLRSWDDEEMTPEQMARDEEALAARILGCKWLQRAWTLEEGSLASSCQFKVADATTTIDLGELVLPDEVPKHFWRDRRRKEYWKKKKKEQKKYSKKHRDSDLETGEKIVRSMSEESMQTGTVPHFGTPLKLLLAGPLNEKRKHAMRHGLSGKYAKSFLKSRGSQFIDAWNELLARSATKPHDSLLILANILDFNSASIAQIQPPEKRLPVIITSSLEIPLGLLFNTDSQVRQRQSIKDSWMPTEIEGDRLTGNAMLRRQSPTESFRLDMSTSPESLHAFIIRPRIAFDEQCIFVAASGPTGEPAEYILEKCSAIDATGKSLWAQQLGASYAESSFDACLLLIDFSSGSSSLNGYAARGALLSVISSSKHQLYARYHTTVTVWTREQWLGRLRSEPSHHNQVHCELLERDYVVDLDQDSNHDAPLQTQRALLKPRPHNLKMKLGWIGYFIAVILGSLAVQLAYPQCTFELEFYSSTNSTDYQLVALKEKCSLYRSFTELGLLVFVTVFIYYVWKWWRRFRFKKWLRTFTN